MKGKMGSVIFDYNAIIKEPGDKGQKGFPGREGDIGWPGYLYSIFLINYLRKTLFNRLIIIQLTN